MKRFQRSVAALAVAVVAGGLGAIAFSTPASAAVVNPGLVNFQSGTATPNVGNVDTGFTLTTTGPCSPGRQTNQVFIQGVPGTGASQFAQFPLTVPIPGVGTDISTDAPATTAYLGTGAYTAFTAASGTVPITTPNIVLTNVASTAGIPFFTNGTYTLTFICRGTVGQTLVTDNQYIGQIVITGATGPNNGTITFTPPVTSVATTTTLTAAPASPAPAGTSVTFTATVAPVPTGGTVQFTVGGANVGAPAAVDASGVATFTTNTLPVGVNSVGAVYSGAAGFATSTATPISYTITAVPNSDTTTTLAVSPVSGPAFQAVTLTGTVVDTTAPITTPTGSCTFLNGATVVGTAPVNAAGVCAVTSTSFGSGTFSFTAQYVPTGPFNASVSAAVAATYAGYNCVAGDVCSDPQTVVVTVPAGNISISTPYTPAAPFNLGTLVLAANGSSYSVSAPFGSAAVPADGVTIIDTRAGALPFTAQIASTNFTNGGNSIANSLLGFTGVTPAYVAGNAINAGTNPVAVTDRPAGQISTTGATFATGTGPGSVNVFGTLGLSNVPTSTPPGLYTATVTFTIS